MMMMTGGVAAIVMTEMKLMTPNVSMTWKKKLSLMMTYFSICNYGIV